MCDYCSCRTQPLIGKLGADHEAISTLAGRVRRCITAGDIGGAHRRFRELASILEPHLRLEEQALFPALRTEDLFYTTLERLEEDHNRVRHAVIGEPEGGDTDRWAAAVGGFLDDLTEHVFTEEHDVFPAARQVVGSTAWETAERTAGAFT